MTKVTAKDLRFVEERLNGRPRKVLRWLTPHEVFTSFRFLMFGLIRAILGISGIIYSSHKLLKLWKKASNKDAFLGFAMLFFFSLLLVVSVIHHNLKHEYAEDFCDYIKDYAPETVCSNLTENDFAFETCHDSFRELNCTDLLENFKVDNAYNTEDNSR